MANRRNELMPLSTGARFGPYEIVSSIGAGGMGEVYRARDTKLKRDVAIKVLPELFASDTDRLARFEREAQAVAALSHPNILAIHDFGSAGGVSYAVMELLEGETLRARLTAGPLSPRKAADHASQIARGLAAAHEKGIIHRDLKPENVFVTTGGHVKILDFGLARHAVPAGGGDRTVTVGTDPGMVMGTVGYMSPEQVRGEPVDHRSDIFSFGAVLYEMLTGRRAFSRNTAAETMTAILRDDPPELVETGRSIPPALDRLVRHCLEKRPEDRFQSARDLAFDLQSTDSGLAPIAKPRVGSRRTMIAVAALLLSVVGAFLAGRLTTSRATTSEWQGAMFRPVTVGLEMESWPSLAPDGRSFSYSSVASGNPDIYVQRIGGHNATNLTKDSPDTDDQPAFSPDGSRIAFHATREGGGIFVMGATGESVRRLSDFGFNPAWSPDGRFLVVSEITFEVPQSRPGFGKLWVIAVEGGAKRPLPTADAVQPAWSPDGSRIAYWGTAEGGRRDIWTVAADGSGGPVQVTSDAAIDWSPVWSPDGRWLYFSSDRNGTMNIWRVAIEQATGRVTSEPSPVVVPAASVGAFSISKDGKALLYGTATIATTLHAMPFDPASARFVGSPQVVLRGGQQIDYIDVSPDGRWIAFGSADRQEDLFLVRTDGTGFRQITDDPYRDRGPRWSPDGSRLAFYSNRQGPYEIWAIRPDGSRLELLARAPDSANGLIRPTWAPDGRRLAAKNIHTRTPLLINLDRPVETRAQPLAAAAATGLIPQSWSPNGERIAGTIEQGPGSENVFLHSLDGKTQVVHTAAAQLWEGSLAWLSDSRRLLFTTQAGGIHLLDSVTGQAREVFPRPRGPVQLPVLAISRDNRVVAYVEMRTEGDLWVMEAKRVIE
jgi:serine/threonine protein kinase